MDVSLILVLLSCTRLNFRAHNEVVDYEQSLFFSVVRRAKRETRPRFARLAASPLPRACIALTKSEEKKRLLAVYEVETRHEILMQVIDNHQHRKS